MPRLETVQNRQAFEYFYAQGPQRSYRKVAQTVNVVHSTVNAWARRFDWPGRVRDRDNGDWELDSIELQEVVEETKAVATIGGITGQMESLIYRTIAVLDGAFEVVEETGEVNPRFTITSATEFTRVVGALRGLMEVRAILEPQKGEVEKAVKMDKLADNLTVVLGGLSEEQKLSLLAGRKVNIPESKTEKPAGGDQTASGDVQEADYTEVPGPEQPPQDG